jgi:hypothetical protein
VNLDTLIDVKWSIGVVGSWKLTWAGITHGIHLLVESGRGLLIVSRIPTIERRRRGMLSGVLFVVVLDHMIGRLWIAGAIVLEQRTVKTWATSILEFGALCLPALLP